jgi:hypothetical protein
MQPQYQPPQFQPPQGQPGYPVAGAGYPQPQYPVQGAYPAYPPRKKAGVFKWILILGLVMTLGCGSLLGLGLLAGTAVDERALTADERAQLLTVDDLSPWVPEYKINRAFESSKYAKTIDGAIELEYNYEHPDEFYVTSSVTIETSLSNAKAVYAGFRIGEGLGAMADKDLRMETRNDLFKAGDESDFSIIRGVNGPLGNRLIARRGTRVVYIQFSGVYFENADDLRDLLSGPVAQALK